MTTLATAARGGLCGDIGGSFVRLASVTETGALGPIARSPSPTDDWDALCRLLRDGCAGVAPTATLSLSVAAAIRPHTGVATSANVPCLDGRSLAADLQEALGRPVRVANDAGCFVLAEASLGVGRGTPVVFGIVLGSGIGGGLVVDGRLIAGAGEWGHGPVLGPRRVGGVEIPSLPCGCGQRGCLDTLAGARGLERLHALMHGTARSSVGIVRAWEEGEPTATATVAAWLDLVAGPLTLVIHATGAGAVPVGGGVSRSHAIVRALDETVRSRLLVRPEAPLVIPAALGPDAGLLGAAARLPMSL